MDLEIIRMPQLDFIQFGNRSGWVNSEGVHLPSDSLPCLLHPPKWRRFAQPSPRFLLGQAGPVRRRCSAARCLPRPTLFSPPRCVLSAWRATPVSRTTIGRSTEHAGPREKPPVSWLRLLVAAFVPTGPRILGLDETAERRRGPKITARAIHRGAARSSRECFQKTSGLRWLSPHLLVPICWAKRVWALAFLTALCPSARYAPSVQRGRRHKPPVARARGLISARCAAGCPNKL